MIINAQHRAVINHQSYGELSLRSTHGYLSNSWVVFWLSQHL